VLHLGKQHHKFIAALTAHGVGAAHRGSQAIRDGLKKLVADGVPERVVNLFEVIQIDIQHSELFALALGKRNRVAEPVLQQRAIRQIGQRIVLGRMRHFRQLHLGLFALRNVANGRSDEDSLRTFQRTQHDLDGEFPAIFGEPVKLNVRPSPYEGAARNSGIVRKQAFGKAFWNDAGDLLADKFIARISKIFLGLNIHNDDCSLMVHHHHGVRRSF
jgi:hypothetical protein